MGTRTPDATGGATPDDAAVTTLPGHTSRTRSPYRRSTESRRRMPQRPVAGPAGPKRARILVGDDDRDRRDAAVRALRALDSIDVCGVAGSPHDVVEAVERTRPDGVLLVTDMPELEQLRAMADLRALHPELPASLMVGVDERTFDDRDAPALLAELRALVDPVARVPFQRVAVVLVPAELTSPRAARRFVTATLESWGLGALRGEAELVVSELVTNVVMHARSPAQVVVGQLDADAVRLEVKDWGHGDLVARRGGMRDHDGRGLRLVDGITTRWGSSTHLGERSVWCDLRLGQNAAPRPAH